VTSGVFAKLDVWNMLATTAGADGLINMVTPGTFNSTLIGAPTFTGDVGYNSDDSSSTKAIDTHYNPSTSGGHFTNGAAGHASFWSMDNAAATGGGGFVMGLANADTTYYSLMIARSATDVAFWSTNSQAFPAAVGGMTNSSGHYVSVRTTTGANEFGYKNAVDQSIGAHSDGTPPSGNIYVLGINLWTTGVSAVFGASALRISTYSIGGALTSGDVTDLCHATNVYLTTISGVSAGVC
jgi:hypothetical protein